MENKVVIIGGGAAGMVAGIFAARNRSNGKKDVLLIEKNEKLGKKVYITGKGRCNITNVCDVSDFMEKVLTNKNFLYSALYGFDSYRTVDFFSELGLKTKVERGSRLYPVSDKSSDVIKALEKELIKNNVKILLNKSVSEIVIENNEVKGVIANGEMISCEKVILATGGISYEATGSTGDGYKFAESNGHSIKKLYPSLVPLVTKENWTKELQGLSLKNISLTLHNKNKKVFSDFGEMLFTHFGISGPLVLTGSAHITDVLKKNEVQCTIDLKPALSDEELDKRILKDFQKYTNKNFINALDDLLPKKMIPVIVKLSGIEPEKKVNEINKNERKNLVDLIKNLTMTITDTMGFSQAVITKGGVDVKEINPSTMESKIIKGLFFAGEIIDVDAQTGGYNLQIAFSTGYLAGESV